MTKKIKTENADRLLEAIRDSELFTCEDTVFGTKARYNGIFSAMGSPKIRLAPISEQELAVSLSAGTLMIIVTLAITVFFWAIAGAALILASGKTAAVAVALLSPCVMWIIDTVVLRQLSKLIISEIENIESNGE